MRNAAPAAIVSILLVLAGPGRAEDPPAEEAAKAAPEWTVPRITHGIEVSRDGKWVACHAVDNVQLFPAGGGDPVTLDCGKDERIESSFTFSPDSRYVCVAGAAGAAVVKGLPEDKTQSVFIFQVAAPTKRRKLELALKAEGLSSEVKKLMEPKLRGMKMLSGSVREFIPLAGSRVIFDRGDLGLTMWDLATEAKFAAPPALESSFSCGISADGAKCVRLAESAIEIRDVKTNRVLQKIATPPRSKKGSYASDPVLTTDGSAVLLLRTTSDPDKAEDRDALSNFSAECWSIAEGRLKWEAPVGSARYVRCLMPGPSHAAAVVGDSLVVLDLRDGAKVTNELVAKRVRSAQMSAAGDAVWVVVDPGTLTRIALPALEEK